MGLGKCHSKEKLSASDWIFSETNDITVFGRITVHGSASFHPFLVERTVTVVGMLVRGESTSLTAPFGRCLPLPTLLPFRPGLTVAFIAVIATISILAMFLWTTP